MKNTDSCY